jgi:hypothetical protein
MSEGKSININSNLHGSKCTLQFILFLDYSTADAIDFLIILYFYVAHKNLWLADG